VRQYVVILFIHLRTGVLVFRSLVPIGTIRLIDGLVSYHSIKESIAVLRKNAAPTNLNHRIIAGSVGSVYFFNPVLIMTGTLLLIPVETCLVFLR